jgi:type IV secretion system protein VirD4
VTRAHGVGDPKRSLIEVRRLLTLAPEDPGEDEGEEPEGDTHGDAAGSAPVDPTTGVHGDPDTWEGLLKDMQRAGGLVERAANRQMQKPDREAGSVISSAQRHTHFLDSPRMKSVLHRTTFSTQGLTRGDLSLYLVLPPDQISSYGGWLRVVLASMIRALTRADRRPSRRVLFLLDEFAQLGHMQPVEDAVSLVAGYGITLWFFIQNLGQLKGNYDDSWQTFLGNVDVLQVFGTKDEETQEYVSKAAGEQTIFQRSTTRNKGKTGSNVQRGRGSSISETGRRLVMTDEIRRMPISKQLLFVENLDPIYSDKLFYLEDEEFGGDSDDEPPLYDENPLH